MTLTTPLALVLLLAVPFVLYIGWPRQRYRRARDITSLILRTTVILLLVLALAGLQVVQSADRLAVVFLVDASDSVGPVATEQAFDIVRDAVENMGDNDEVGVVVFGADAQVERLVGNVRELGPVRSAVPAGNTDIAEAIRLALALFPADAARRIVVLSDGIATQGDSEAAAQLAAASGVEISYIPIDRESGADIRVTGFDAPSSVPEGQEFDLNLTIASDQDTQARIDVFAGGELIISQETALRQGSNNRTVPLQGGSAGFRDFSVEVVPLGGGDLFSQNNRLSTFSQIVGPARVLLVSNTPEDSTFIIPALENAGLSVDEVAPSGLPNNVTGLAQYNAVILVNVPATRFTNRRMETLNSYVRDLGGGLVTVGGPEAYGPGGYFQTPLEDALPVEMQLRDQQRLPQLTIAYVIDRSGSMAASGPDGVPNIELAKAAINRSIDFLQPRDRAAIASFDTAGYWIAEFQDVLDRVALQQLVGTLRPSGGTDVLAGMRLVAEDIVSEPSQIKHIILLTDGQTNPARLVATTDELFRQNGVTTTTIAIGGDSQLLRDMAIAGGGNYHIATDIGSIPTIFAQETVLATRSYIFEESFVPSLTVRSPIMQGINALPQLQGYVGVTAKNAAEVVLRGPEPFSDPILASWQYGLGRAVAFTSDATSRWAVDWVTWDSFARFWNQAVRWTITEGGSSNLETRVVQEDEQARIVVDARADDGAFLNGLNLTASVVDPTLGNRRVPLRQVAPGRYEATFTPDVEGAYLLRITGEGSDDQAQILSQTTGWVRSYSPEYLNTGAAASVLPDLAEITGGRSMAEDVLLAFERNLEARASSTPLWPWLLLAALLLLPLDIAVRRLLVTRRDLQRLRGAVSGRMRPAVADGPSERMSTLFDARERARQRTQDAAPPSPVRPQVPQSPPPAEPAVRPTPQPQRSASSPTEDGGNIGARLLKKRRERDEEQ